MLSILVRTCILRTVISARVSYVYFTSFTAPTKAWLTISAHLKWNIQHQTSPSLPAFQLYLPVLGATLSIVVVA